MKKRIFSVILTLVLIIQMVPITGLAGEQGGEFCLIACTDSDVVIDPCFVEYDAEDSIKAALEKSGHDFAGIENGFITEIDGVSASYYLTDNEGGYDLEKEASEITCVAFLGIDLSMVEDEEKSELCSLICKMAEYLETENGVKSYAPAQKAYRAAEKALFNTDADFAAREEAIEEAMQSYIDEVLNAPTFDVQTAFADHNGETLKNFEFCVTNEFGKEERFDENSDIKLAEGEYEFVLSQGEYKAEGAFSIGEEGLVKIGENVIAEIQLFTGDWLQTPILHADNNALVEAFQMKDDRTFLVPDYIGPKGLLIFIPRGEDSFDEKYASVRPSVSYKDVSNSIVERKKSWESKADSISNLLNKGDEGNSFTVECSFSHEDGYVQTQSVEYRIERTPSLKEIKVFSDGILQDVGFTPKENSYELKVVSDSVSIEAEPLVSGTEVKINGKTAKAGEASEISLEDETAVEIEAIYKSGINETYTLNIHKVASSLIKVNHEKGVAVHVYNTAGAEIGAAAKTASADTFRLIPDETYRYVADRSDYYHTAQNFTAVSGQAITAVTPEFEEALSDISFYDAAGNLCEKDQEFSSTGHNYTVNMPDADSNFYVSLKTVDKAYKCSLVETEGNLNASKNNVMNFLKQGSESQIMTIRVTTEKGEIDRYQDFVIKTKRILTFDNISIKVDGSSINLFKSVDGLPINDNTFERMHDEYYAYLVRASEKAEITLKLVSPEYFVIADGQRYEAKADDETGVKESEIVITKTFDTAEDFEEISIEIGSSDKEAEAKTYHIEFEKKDAVETSYNILDENGEAVDGAIILVYDSKTKKRILPNEEGLFPLVDSMNYNVIVTCHGYVGQRFDITSSMANAEKTVILEKAADRKDYDITSAWPNFRGTDDAIGVFNMKTPNIKSKAVLSWANQLGEGYSSGAVSCPILITEDGYDYLIVYAGEYLFKVDALTGTVVTENRMDHKSSFAINSPTYAEGMIFVGLANGCVQAFDAKTLESLWIYNDVLGGQPNCPITYNNGYIYTGFWNSETANANYVCLSVTDEDLTNEKEEKLPTWTYSCGKGFYWAGAYVCDDYLLVGTDDGDSGYIQNTSSLLCLDSKDGRFLDSYDGLRGDIRSNVSYDKNTDRFFFTSKGGYFYSVKVENDNGDVYIADDSFKEIYLDNYGNDRNKPPMSTCTPVVYNNRAYIGVSGTSQFGAYSGHNITVLDLNKWEIAYSVPTQGYPQTSGLLTTAYEDEEGYIYVYFFDNYTPGKLRVLKDKEGLTAPVNTEVEIVKENGTERSVETPEVLFTPNGKQEQYAICSPIADDHGTMYFKNDSAYLMSLTNTIKSIEVVNNPAKTTYKEGESFDAAGMVVRITYDNDTYYDLPDSRVVNGKTLKYFTWNEEPLTGDKTSIEIKFPYVMYQNNDNGVGQSVESPTVVLPITVEGIEPSLKKGDINGDNKINRKDYIALNRYLNEENEFSDEQKLAADVNEDGKINRKDAIRYAQFLAEKIAEL